MTRTMSLAFGFTCAIVLLLSEKLAVSASNGIAFPRCKSIPGDFGWPSATAWAKLNRTVNGKLIATAPRAGVCHTTGLGSYDETACEELKAEWDYPQAQ